MTGTDERGHFEFEGLPPGRVRLIALRSDAALETAANSEGVQVRTGDSNIRLRLAAHAAIRIEVDSHVVEGARDLSFRAHLWRVEEGRRVRLWARNLDAGWLARQGGRFETPALDTSRSYDLEVWAQGFPKDGENVLWDLAFVRLEGVAPGGPVVRAVLDATASLRGVVVDPGGARAGEDIEVRAIPAAAEPLVRAALLAGDDEVEGYRRPDPAAVAMSGEGPFYSYTDASGAFHFQRARRDGPLGRSLSQCRGWLPASGGAPGRGRGADGHGARCDGWLCRGCSGVLVIVGGAPTDPRRRGRSLRDRGTAERACGSSDARTTGVAGDPGGRARARADPNACRQRP